MRLKLKNFMLYVRQKGVNKMKKYVGPVYASSKIDNDGFSLFGLSFDISPENNSVTVFEDAENLFE